jgi:hypothetical protein
VLHLTLESKRIHFPLLWKRDPTPFLTEKGSDPIFAPTPLLTFFPIFPHFFDPVAMRHALYAHLLDQLTTVTYLFAQSINMKV